MRARILIPLILTALVSLSLGVLVAVLVIPTPTPKGLEPAADPASASVGMQQFADERTVEISFETTPEETMTSRVMGTVSETLCSPGTPVNSGSRLMSVDGKPVIALYTSTPLYRELKISDNGPDVAALQQELARLGYAAEGNGVYGWRTENGVKTLMQQAGTTNPDGKIKPADIIWIPSTSVTPSQCPAGLNSMVNDGSEIMKTGGVLTAVSYTVPADLREGQRTLSLFGVTAQSEKAEGHINDQNFLNALAASDGYRTARADTSGEKPTATLTLSKPIDATKVPPSAIFGQTDNKACVSEDGKTGIPVNIIGSALGSTLIQPDDVNMKIDKVHVGESTENIDCPADDKR
jgi:peptidoglycan hydrolase-like protein with peptidoglycan-binding domain